MQFSTYRNDETYAQVDMSSKVRNRQSGGGAISDSAVDQLIDEAIEAEAAKASSVTPAVVWHAWTAHKTVAQIFVDRK